MLEYPEIINTPAAALLLARENPVDIECEFGPVKSADGFDDIMARAGIHLSLNVHSLSEMTRLLSDIDSASEISEGSLKHRANEAVQRELNSVTGAKSAAELFDDPASTKIVALKIFESLKKVVPAEVRFNVYEGTITLKSNKYLASKRKSGITAVVAAGSVISKVLSQISDDEIRSMLYEKFITGDVDEKHIRRMCQNVDGAVVSELMNLLQKRMSAAPPPFPQMSVAYAISGKSLITYEHPAGRKLRKVLPQSLRCVKLVPGASNALLLGGKTEVYYVKGGSVVSTFQTVAGPAEIKGGYNSVILMKNRVFATHSELGIRMWDFTEGTVPDCVQIMKDVTGTAKTVRCLTPANGDIMVAAGNSIARFNVDSGKVAASYSQPHSNVTQFIVIGDYILAGTEDGFIVKWAMSEPKSPVDVLSTDGAISRIHASEVLGIPHVFYSSGKNWVRARWPDVSIDTSFETKAGVRVKSFTISKKLLVAGSHSSPEILFWHVDHPRRCMQVGLPEFDITGIIDISCYVRD